MTVRTEVHAAGDTRERPLLSQAKSTVVAILPMIDLHTTHNHGIPMTKKVQYVPDFQMLKEPEICTMVPNLLPGFAGALQDSPPETNKIN